MRRRYLVAGIGGGALVLSLLAIATLPILVRWVAVNRIAAMTGSTAAIADVDLNLFTRRLVVHDLRVDSAWPDSPPLLEVKRIDARFRLWAALHGRPHLDDVELDSPQLRVVRVRAPGTPRSTEMSIEPILDRLMRGEKRSIAYNLEHLVLRDGHVVFDDRTAEPAVTWEAVGLRAELHDIATVADSEHGTMEARFRLAGAPVSIQAHDIEMRPLTARIALDIDQLDISRFWSYVSAPGFIRGLELLSAAYRLALKDGRLSHTPRIESLPEHNTCTGFFEADQFDALVGHLPDYLQDLARFAYRTGWRKGDLVKLRWDTVDLEGGVIRLRSGDTKTGKGRVLALDTTLRALIERRHQDRLTGTAEVPVVSDYVFHRKGRPVGDIRKAWAAACKAAGIQSETKMRAGREVIVPGRKVHDFRRTAARDMIRSGTPETVVMAVTGHSTRAMLDRYNITSERDTREAMARVSAYHAATSGSAGEEV